MNEHVNNKQATYSYIKNRLEGKKDSYGMLMKEIVRSGICTHCSACCAVCDVLEWDPNTHEPKLIGKCTGCGICYNQCPRTISVPEQLIGHYRSAFIARTLIPEVKGQDGGATTSLLLYLLDKGLIDGAVVTKRDENWNAIPIFAKTKEQILDASGSIYIHSQTVTKLFEALEEGYHAIAFVGTPCNIDAIAKMENSPNGMMFYNFRTKILKIGLFCMDSFTPETLHARFRRDGIDLSEIDKMDISLGKFHLWKGGERVKSYTIKSLNKYKSTSCNFCTDLTSENADISFGSVGSPEGYNTVICRTPVGEYLLKDAAENGYLEIKPIDDKALDAVYKLAKMKKVSQYNIQVRTQYVFTPMEKIGMEEKVTTVESPITTTNDLSFLTKKLKLKNAKLVENRNTLKFTLVNDSGYIMENINIHIALVEDVFEKASWHTKVPGLYPYESMIFDYPINIGNVDKSPLEILVEVKAGAQPLLNEKISIQKLIEKANAAAAKKSKVKK
ncbi:MAG: Coenzyme F420 hydrogenase/dehydrogenase, beta subunit C-terminal domain [Promethearchaeota archaeon]